MDRVKIKFSQLTPIFTTEMPIRITDINYGNHLANDAVLGIIHEIRMRWLAKLGWSELDLNKSGIGLIMADVMIAYKAQGFYGDVLQADLFVAEVEAKSFSLLYKLTTIRADKRITIAEAKTGMVFFNYSKQQIASTPEFFRNLYQS